MTSFAVPPSARDRLDYLDQVISHLRQVDNVDDLYGLIGTFVDITGGFYPTIACQSGCFSCCTDGSMPIVSALEWEKLFAHLRDRAPEQNSLLIAQSREFMDLHWDALWQLHDAAQHEATSANQDVIKKAITSLKGTRCLFHNGRICTVYDDRPAKCRIHGYFLLKTSEMVQLHACEDERERLENHFQRMNNRSVVYPKWNPFEAKLRLMNDDPYVSSILPIWIYSHLSGDEWVDQVNLRPNFEILRVR